MTFFESQNFLQKGVGQETYDKLYSKWKSALHGRNLHLHYEERAKYHG